MCVCVCRRAFMVTYYNSYTPYEGKYAKLSKLLCSLSFVSCLLFRLLFFILKNQVKERKCHLLALLNNLSFNDVMSEKYLLICAFGTVILRCSLRRIRVIKKLLTHFIVVFICGDILIPTHIVH